MRWIQQGVFHPRFSIHSWNSDGTVNSPWLHAEVLPAVRAAIRFRYRLLPYLYSLHLEASLTGHPIIRPLVYHFAGAPCFTRGAGVLDVVADVIVVIAVPLC